MDSDFWGASADGVKGQVQANLKRVIPVVYAMLGVLKFGKSSRNIDWMLGVHFLCRYLTFAMMLCKGKRIAAQFFGCPILVLSLAPLAAILLLSARNSAYHYESDTSTWGIVACRARLPGWLQSEIHRHRLRKQVCSKLLSPSRSLSRIKGLLPPAEELSGDQIG